MVNLKVKLCGIALDNPVIPASGTFGYGSEYAELYDINCLGSFSFKGTTLEPRFGNPTPRIAECPDGMINAVRPSKSRCGRGDPRGAALRCGGFSTSRSWQTSAAFRSAIMSKRSRNSRRTKRQAARSAGMRSTSAARMCMAAAWPLAPARRPPAEVTAAVRRATDKPLLLKLSPNVTDITEIARACEAAGADGISLINTLLGMRIDLKTRRPVIANKMGGFSGHAILPVALRMVWQVYEAVKLPIVGMGGVSSAEK